MNSEASSDAHSTWNSTRHSALQLRTRSHHTSDVETFSPEIGAPTSSRVNNNPYGTLQLAADTREVGRFTNVSLQYGHGEAGLPHQPWSAPFISDSFSTLTSLDLQQQPHRPVVPEAQLNVYHHILEKLSNSLSQEQVRELCYLSQEAEYEGVRHRANLNGTMLFNFFEQQVLIAPNNLEYLRVLLYKIGRMDLCNFIDHYTKIYMGGQPAPLVKPTIQAPPFNSLQLPSAPPPVDTTQHHEIRYHPSMTTFNSLQDQLSTPIPVLDEVEGPARLALPARNKVNYLYQPQEGGEPVVAYQNRVQQQAMEERELQYRSELEQKERLLQQRQMQLQDREEMINQLTRQYEQQLHVLREVQTNSNSEKERLQQQIREYEETIRRNVAQIQALRGENAHVLIPFGPVAERYSMKRTPHGIAVIINNSEFYSNDPANKALPNCRFSQVDEENLRVTWEYLQYDVRILRNLTASELTRQLMQIALQSHENYDSFVCCILSHGYLDGIYGTDSQPVKINDIASLFKGSFCPTLSNKPKLFFIQACREDDKDKGLGVPFHNDDALRHSLPSETDFLFGYVFPPGNVSWRSPRYGSWYISKLCEVLVDNAPQQDLLTMLTMVSHKVSEAYTTQGYKQCPAPVTLLRKQVWFFEMVS